MKAQAGHVPLNVGVTAAGMTAFSRFHFALCQRRALFLFTKIILPSGQYEARSTPVASHLAEATQ
jgi:hypothetical protein